MRSLPVWILATAALACTTELPIEAGATDLSTECAEAVDADACRDIEGESQFCGMVTSADACAGDPYVDTLVWTYDGCVATNVTCTQSFTYLQTDEGCRVFDACYAPTDLASCDPALDCPVE